jgi:hypothetical protein
MSTRNLELADWKLSAAIALTRYVAEDRDNLPSCEELRGLYFILRDVQELITTPAAFQQGDGTKMLEKEVP